MSKKELLRIFTLFLKIGAFTFGGGYAMIPLMEQTVVEETEWMTKEEFLDMVAICQCLPGAFALNVAVYTGYRLGRMPGVLAATLGVSLPSFLIVLTLSGALIEYGDRPDVQRVFSAMIPAVTALVGVSAIRLGIQQKWDVKTAAIGAVSGLIMFVLGMSPLWAILMAGLMGVLLFKGEGGSVL